jgi:uncharacterized protein YutE (UPF0331/DUF86 family)
MLELHLQRAERLAAVTQQVGFALWQLQELEFGAAHYFVLLVQAAPGMGHAAAESIVNKALGKTFGTTIHLMTKARLLDDGFASRFTSLLAERNWLVHRSRADSRGAIYGEDAMQALLRRLERIANEAEELLKEIVVRAKLFVSAHGVSEHVIDRATQQLLKQWHGA